MLYIIIRINTNVCTIKVHEYFCEYQNRLLHTNELAEHTRNITVKTVLQAGYCTHVPSQYDCYNSPTNTTNRADTCTGFTRPKRVIPS